jgi:hypothetical protein
MKSNILSLDQLLEHGYTTFMKKRKFYLRGRNNRFLTQVEMIKNHMFKLNLVNIQIRYLKACVEDKT